MIKLITFRWLNISNNKKHPLGFVLCCKGLCLSLPPARTSVWQNREGLVLPISFSSLVFAKSGEIAVFVCSISSSEDSFLLFKLLWKTSFGSLNFETAIFHMSTISLSVVKMQQHPLSVLAQPTCWFCIHYFWYFCRVILYYSLLFCFFSLLVTQVTFVSSR